MSVKPRELLITQDDEEKAQYCWKRRSRLEKILLVVLVVLLFLVIGLAIATGCARNKVKRLNRRIKELDGGSICTSQECINSAAAILAAVNSSADPCEDFDAFACGNWVKGHPIPDDQSSYGTATKITAEVDAHYKVLLSAPSPPNEAKAIKKAKLIYRTCINEDRVWNATTQNLLTTLESYGGWPIATPDADVSNFDWISVEASFSNAPTPHALIDFGVDMHPKNMTFNIIQIAHPTPFTLAYVLLYPTDYKIYVDAYKQLIIDVANYFSNGTIPLATVTKDVENMMEFETQITNISSQHQYDPEDPEEKLDPVTIKELQSLTDDFSTSNELAVKHFEWLRFFQTIFKDVWTIEETEPVIIGDIEYMNQLALILDQTDKRVLANYMLWVYIFPHLNSISREMSHILMKYKAVMEGIRRMPERSRICLEEMREPFGLLLGRLLVQSYFPPSSKPETIEMIHEIRTAFMQMLDENDWLDDETKKAAKIKANQMTYSAVYPDWILNDTRLDEFYKEVNISELDHASNLKSIAAAENKRMLQSLREYPDNTVWDEPPGVVNAFYIPDQNSMRIHAGIMMFPYFTSGGMKALNYGGLGHTIGHEITHGFDNDGRLYDKDGVMTKWWNDEAIGNFTQRSECYVEQYSKFCTKPEEVLNTTLCLNGNNTLGENIADDGGLKASYKAYRNWVARNGEEPKLPGLNYTPDQLYFISYGLSNCENSRPEGLQHDILTGTHSPDKYRNLGTVANSKDFARVFNCPADSQMNRGDDRCNLW